MANTTVHIGLKGKKLGADLSGIPIVAGNSVTFQTDEDTAAALCFNAAARAILSPSPAADGAQIPEGGSLTFTFESASEGDYAVQLQFPDLPCPTRLKGAGGATLSIFGSQDIDFPDPPDPDPVGDTRA